jgi:hypothetical protein
MIEQQAIQAAQKAGVSPAVFLGLIQQESSFNPNAESSAGAIGLTQFEPSTLEGMGISVESFLNSITVQLQAGADYLASLLTKYNGNYSLALAAYNAGSGAVDEYGGIPPYPETENYVQKVLGYAQGFASSLGVELPLSKLGQTLTGNSAEPSLGTSEPPLGTSGTEGVGKSSSGGMSSQDKLLAFTIILGSILLILITLGGIYL